MSIESLATALHHSRATGSAKLVLLGIANHDGDGGSWPAISTLMRYAGGIDRRNVIRALDKLESLGEIRRVKGQGGDHSTADHRRPNLYRFLLQCPHDCDRSSQHRTSRATAVMLPEELSTGVALTPRGGADATGGGGADATGGGGADATLTILLTRTTQEEETGHSTRARVCRNGHPIIDRSSAGVPFCALGCAPALTLVDA